MSNDNFEIVQLNDSPTRFIRLRVDIPFIVKKWLIKCLKVNVNLFATSPDEMPNIDLSMACHRLNIDHFICYVAHQRRRQSPNKFKVTKKTAQGFLEANFIFEVRYIEWISNDVFEG